MSEVKRYWVPCGSMNMDGWHQDDNEVVLAGEHDKAMNAAQSELAEERQNNVDLGAECNRLNSELSALREENERLKSESFEDLYNAVIDERDALREELADCKRSNEIIYHFGKLQASVKRGDEDGIREYAADVANMCMMLVDICACIDKVKEMNK